MTVPTAMIGGSALLGALMLVATVFAIRRGGGVGWTLGIIAAIVALTGIGFAAFAVWGRYAGMPWDFAGLAAQ